MTWQYPKPLGQMPLVLAGPILRKVAPKSVTVWFILQKSATVTLTVSDETRPLLTGKRDTYAIGKSLHIVAVTANESVGGAGALTEGVLYRYDVSFSVAGGGTLNLAQATKDAVLSYLDDKKPSFCLPPSQANQLRIFHGSCRHPNGGYRPAPGQTGGKDALALLDGLIFETAMDPIRRPHQLFLTGDQIYADDVSAAHLLMLTAASDQLLGWQEELPLSTKMGPRRPASKIPPLTRKAIVADIGFTSDAGACHLLSLGEYICMYLFVWSDVLWTEADIPNLQDVVAILGAVLPNFKNEYDIDARPGIARDIDFLKEFRKSLPEVRRALANIPSYMIFDDHEITDDFNMSRKICEQIYADGNEMGRRVVQNGLIAYALCQHWGNVPEDFFQTAPKPPGLNILEKLHGGTAETYRDRSAELARLVAVHKASALKSPPESAVGKDRKGVFALFHDEDALRFDYALDFPAHHVIFADTRTWRAFPNGPDEGGELLPKDQILKQIRHVRPDSSGKIPNPDRPLFLVIPTNAPPSKVIRFGTRYPRPANKLSSTFKKDASPDLFEAWELPSPPLDRLLAAISDRLPLVTDKDGATRRGSVILLSGDVHSSSASRLHFAGVARFEDTTKQRVNMVAAQLISSSLKNRSEETLAQHRAGYSHAPFVEMKIEPEGFVGWNFPPGTKKQIGVRRSVSTGPVSDLKPGMLQYAINVTGSSTFGIEELGSNPLITIEPEYAYRFDYIHADTEFPIPKFALTSLPKPNSADISAQANKFREITANYNFYMTTNISAREMVGENNISEITFKWDEKSDIDRKVFQTVRWHDGKTLNQVNFTRYTVNLSPDLTGQSDNPYKFMEIFSTLGWNKPLSWGPSKVST